MSPFPSARSLRSQLGLNSLITVVLGLALLGIANYVGFRYYYRHDFSKNNYYLLSDKTLSLLKNLPEPVQVTTSLSTSGIRPQVEGLLREYKYRGNGKVRIDFVDAGVDLSKAEELAKKYNLDPTQENVVIFEYKDRHKVLNDSELADYGPPNPMTGEGGEMRAFKGEAQFTAAIQALVEGKPSKVYFLTGHGERDLTDTANAGGIGSLNVYVGRDNIVSAPLSFAQAGGIPDDADALVIAGPRSPLAPNEVQAVGNYLAANGKVILFLDPKTVSGLESIAQRYGIQIQDDRVVGSVSVGGAKLVIGTAIGTDYADHPAVRALKGIQFKIENARSLALVKDPANANTAKVVSLVRTPANFWGETNLDDPKPQFDANVDLPGPLTLASVYDGGEIPGDAVAVAGTRLAIVGSSVFLTNEKIDGVGLDFFLTLLDWMLKKNVATGIAPKEAQEFGLHVSPLQESTIIVLALLVVPGAAALVGFAVWLARRR